MIKRLIGLENVAQYEKPSKNSRFATKGSKDIVFHFSQTRRSTDENHFFLQLNCSTFFNGNIAGFIFWSTGFFSCNDNMAIFSGLPLIGFLDGR